MPYDGRDRQHLLVGAPSSDSPFWICARIVSSGHPDFASCIPWPASTWPGSVMQAPPAHCSPLQGVAVVRIRGSLRAEGHADASLVMIGDEKVYVYHLASYV